MRPTREDASSGLAAQRAKTQGANVIGIIGESPANARDGGWIAGYTYCARQAVPGTRVLVDYSSESLGPGCPKLTEEETEGARAILIIEGACTTSGVEPRGPGDSAHLWSSDGTLLASATKELTVGLTTAVKLASQGSWAGGSDLQLGLASGGVKLGQVDPATPTAVVAELAAFRHRIKTNRLIVPTVP